MSHKKTIRIAHSPDSDDAFMFYAMKFGKVGADRYDFVVERRDIEELNQAARRGEYDITAISFHAYAHVADKYALLASGSSMAEKTWGPVVVARSPIYESAWREITTAIPGEWTTSALLLKILRPEARTFAVPFEKIISRVVEGEVDAGLLIHEGQMEFARHGLVSVLRLLDGWKNILTARGASVEWPLPLGGNAIRKDLGPAVMHDLAQVMRKSVEWAFAHHEEARDYARQFKRGMSASEADTYLSWYANARTRDMGDDGRQALQLLYQEAQARHILPTLVVPEIY